MSVDYTSVYLEFLSSLSALGPSMVPEHMAGANGGYSEQVLQPGGVGADLGPSPCTHYNV